MAMARSTPLPSSSAPPPPTKSATPRWIWRAARRLDQRLADQRDAVELAVEVGSKDVGRREMRGRAIVPERDVAFVPLEAHRVFRAGDMLPQHFEELVAFARR